MDYDQAQAALAKAMAGPPYKLEEEERAQMAAAFAFVIVDAARSLDAICGSLHRIAEQMERR